MCRLTLMAVMALGVALGGCGPRAVVKDPSAITLRAALSEVGEGLAAMVKAQPASSDFGVYPAEVTVSFNVAASGTGTGSLLVTPGMPNITPASERAGLNASVSETASRANTVTVKFVNVLFAPPDSLVQHVTGAQLFELRQAMLGIDPRQVLAPVQVQTTEAAPTRSAAETAGTPGAAPVAIDDAIPASTPERARPSLPAMKFMSPSGGAEDAAALVRSLPAEKLGILAKAMNTRVGMEVVSPAAPEGELRESLVEATKRLMLKRAEVESMVRGGR